MPLSNSVQKQLYGMKPSAVQTAFISNSANDSKQIRHMHGS